MNSNPTITIAARLKPGETLGDRVLKVDHAGEHGAVNIYRGQRHASIFRSQSFRDQLSEMQSHEEKHRDLFWNEMKLRQVRRCRSYHLCGLGGYLLGFVTGLASKSAVAATTYAVEHVVLEHLDHQLASLATEDSDACAVITAILADEKAHHDHAAESLDMNGPWVKILAPVVAISTELVIWLGMRL